MLALFIPLVAAWLLWSGIYKPLLLGLGILSCALTIYVKQRMDYFETDLYALRFGRRLFGYWLWLAKEIVKSSLDVARIVLSPSLPISPKVVKIEASCEHPVDQAILANSITLTPGTLALDVYKGEITVHALTQAGADELERGEMDRRVLALRDV
ncbi:MAG: Na+/H+ antiporter subunit E, partial [Gammaproteobacteria bacterium]|nr:Na+/H+ antiporter subunit E [Gammaproteobacteria bacterium]NNL51729.1 Na+/H+ antiporter subunit E [Woeseiaceae bacterium]